MPRGRLWVVGFALAISALAPATASATVPAAAGGPEVGADVHHDVSPPLRSMSATAPGRPARVHPLRPLPGGTQPGSPDGAVQSSAGPLATTSQGLNIAGVGDGDYGFTPDAAPPDPNGAVGATQYVQWVNESLAVFNKTTGAIATGFPKPGNAVWSGFGGGCETNNDGDPVVKYDQIAGRWILTQFSVSTTPYLQCLAVSTTSDATGSYHRYAFSFGNVQFPDYPKLGVWPAGYYMTFNIFNNGTSFAGAKLCSLDRSAMLSGAAATMQCFQLSSSFGGVLPADLDGATLPPSGSPNFLLNFGTNSLNEWKFHVDFGTPGNTTLTGPLNIPVAPFTPACGGGTCIVQPHTSTRLDSLGDRLMYRLSYRNFGDHEALVVDHSVNSSGTRKNAVVGVRWYELRSPNATKGATVYQQGTFSPDTTSRWMGSIAMDKFGDIAVGYSASSGTTYPSIRYTGRLPTDPLSTLEAETTATPGGGSQINNLHRWGDYTSLAIDPADDCTFFYTNEYLKTSGSFNWSTRFVTFRFPGCT